MKSLPDMLSVRTLLGYLPANSIGLKLSTSAKVLFITLSSGIGLFLRHEHETDFMPHLLFALIIVILIYRFGGVGLLRSRICFSLALSSISIGLVRWILPPLYLETAVEKVQFSLTISAWYMSSCLSAIFTSLLLRPGDLGRLASRLNIPGKIILIICIPLSTLDLISLSFRQSWIAAWLGCTQKSKLLRFHAQVVCVSSPILVSIIDRSQELSAILGRISVPLAGKSFSFFPNYQLFCKTDLILLVPALPLIFTLIYHAI